jgi:hypothetical protein
VPLAVGRSALTGHPLPWILQGIEHRAPTSDCGALGRRIAARPGRTALLAVADGSARRGEKAPGYIDPRAEGADAHIADALDSADPDALLALDAGLCEDLLIAGRAAWQVMAGACDGTPWLARTLYHGDPFGVTYRVVTWAPRPPRPPGDGAGREPVRHGPGRRVVQAHLSADPVVRAGIDDLRRPAIMGRCAD